MTESQWLAPLDQPRVFEEKQLLKAVHSSIQCLEDRTTHIMDISTVCWPHPQVPQVMQMPPVLQLALSV